jgi:hypothetical protein
MSLPAGAATTPKRLTDAFGTNDRQMVGRAPGGAAERVHGLQTVASAAERLPARRPARGVLLLRG